MLKLRAKVLRGDEAMHLDALLAEIRRQPFRPFRVHISDGASYDVRHPELCMAGKRTVVIGIANGNPPEPVFDRYVSVDLIHITRLEPLDQTTTSQSQAG